MDVPKTLHPDAARSRKRNLKDPGEEQKVSRERSTSRHQEVDERGDLTAVNLRRKYREQQMIEAGKRVEKPIKQRGRRDFCHDCKKPRVFKELLCKKCGHERCFACQVALID
jgi:hypothetical protein